MKIAMVCVVWIGVSAAGAQTAQQAAPLTSPAIAPFTGKAPRLTIAGKPTIWITKAARLMDRSNVCYAMRSYGFAADKDATGHPMQTSLTTCQAATSFTQKRANVVLSK
jgi:hypothetical protein